MNDSAPDDFVVTMEIQRQRLMRHVSALIPPGQEMPPRQDVVDRMLQAFMASMELIKAAENELLEMRALRDRMHGELARFHALFDRAPAPLLITTSETTIRSANTAATSLLCCEPAELLGRELSDLVAPAHRRGFRANVRSLIENGRAGAWSCEFVPYGRKPVSVKAAIHLIDDPAVSNRALYWSLSA